MNWKSKNIRPVLLYLLLLDVWPTMFSVAAATGPVTNSWSLASPDGRNEISVSLDGTGGLSYEVRSSGKIVIQKSPLGLQCDDQDLSAL